MAERLNKVNALPRAVAYLRFATDPGGARAALARHICQRRANELGAVVVSTYTDTTSGWTDDRPQLKRMLSDLTETSEITCVIVPGHPTIGLNMQIYSRVVWKIEQAGALLVVAAAPLETYRAMKSRPHDDRRGPSS